MKVLRVTPAPLCAGAALDYVLRNSFVEAAGARPGFPKVVLVISASKSQDSVEVQARRLRSAGVEVFVLGELRRQRERVNRSTGPVTSCTPVPSTLSGVVRRGWGSVECGIRQTPTSL